MNKDKKYTTEGIDTDDELNVDEYIEPLKREAPQEEPVEGSKDAYLFPNMGEGEPFAGEFASRQEAEEANKHYLEQTKKENNS